MTQVVEWGLRRRENLDSKTVEELTRAVVGSREPFADPIEIKIRRRAREPHVEIEDLRAHVVEPEPRRRSAEQMIMSGKRPPRAAAVRGRALPVAGADPERLERDPLAVEHPVEVVIRRDEQLHGVGEVLVRGEPARVGVTVRAHDRQSGDRGVQPTSDGACRRLGGKQPILGQDERWVRSAASHGASIRSSE